MSSPTRREVSHDPSEIEPKHKRFSRLNRKLPGSHPRKTYTPTESKMPKISWKHFTVLTKVSLRSLKVMKIMRKAKVKINHHLKCPFGVHQTYLQEL
jgi:hypothetical protein